MLMCAVLVEPAYHCMIKTLIRERIEAGLALKSL